MKFTPKTKWSGRWRPRGRHVHPNDLETLGRIASRRIGSETRANHYLLQARLERQKVCVEKV